MIWWKILGILFLLVIIFFTIYSYQKWTQKKEGFQSTDTSLLPAEWTSTYTMTTTGGVTSYTIFDPEPAYVQAKMMKVSMWTPYKNLKGTEINLINSLLDPVRLAYIHRYVHTWACGPIDDAPFFCYGITGYSNSLKLYSYHNFYYDWCNTEEHGGAGGEPACRNGPGGNCLTPWPYDVGKMLGLEPARVMTHFSDIFLSRSMMSLHSTHASNDPTISAARRRAEIEVDNAIKNSPPGSFTTWTGPSTQKTGLYSANAAQDAIDFTTEILRALNDNVINAKGKSTEQVYIDTKNAWKQSGRTLEATDGGYGLAQVITGDARFTFYNTMSEGDFLIYINNLINNFDTEILHTNFLSHPIGWLLYKIETRINQFGSSIYIDPPKGCNTNTRSRPSYYETPPSCPLRDSGAAVYDAAGNIFYANPLSLSDPNDTKNIIDNPNSWRLVDVVPDGKITDGKPTSNLYKRDLLAKKGITIGADASLPASQPGILTKKITITGTMSNTNMDEIRRSVYYSMFFNFSDKSTDRKQLRYSANANAPMLYFSKSFNFEDELKLLSNKSLEIDLFAVKKNAMSSAELTDDVLLLLPYQMRSYIGSWGASRRIAMLQYFKQNQDIITLINQDIQARTFNPLPKINLFSVNNNPATAYIQTTQEIQFRLTFGANYIKNNPNLFFTTTHVVYLNQANIKDVEIIVTCTDVVNINHSFKGRIVSYVPNNSFNPPRSGLLTMSTVGYENYIVDPRPNITFIDYGIPTYNSYMIRFAIPDAHLTDTTPVIKGKIMDAIAQCYYDLNVKNNDASASGVRMTTILDIYQIGHTIFDARYRIIERDADLTGGILAQISTLKTEHAQYRAQSTILSESELVTLEDNYNTQLQTLIMQLENAVQGYTAPVCGKKARFVTVSRTDGQPIQLSQIEIIDNTNQNIALGTNVTWGPYQQTKAYIFPYEDCSGSVLGAYDPGSGAPGLISYQNTNIIYSSQLNKVIEMNHLLSIVDGTTEARYEPDIFRSPVDKNGNLIQGDCVQIDLSFEYNISYVRLTLPKNTTGTLPTYVVTLKNQNYGAILDGIVSTTPTDPANFKVSAVFLPESDSVCPRPPNALFDLYRTARFYADIVEVATPEYTSAGNGKYIKFTGFSEGTDSALSFNEMYNGGFKIDLHSPAGNANYQPNIKYDTRRATSLPDLVCSNDPTQIMYDYMLNITTERFQSRNASNYDDAHTYYVSSVTGYAAVPTNPDNTTTLPNGQILYNSRACNFKWTELEVETATNLTTNIINRSGTLVYVRNIYDWKLSNDIYDPSNSYILSDPPPANITFTPCSFSIPKPGITEVPLDNLSGRCANKSCGDLDVIDNIVKGYNLVNSDSILRVMKAVTPAPTKCEFECYTKNSPTTPTRIRMDLAIDMDLTTYTCRYSYLNSEIVTEDTTGTYIQSNTPLLTQVYSYATELMSYYTTSMNSIYKNLSTMIVPHLSQTGSGITAATMAYREDSWKAFGQIKGLSSLCATSCTDPVIIQTFLQNNRNFATRIAQIKGAGTTSKTSCDFMVDETTLSTGPSGLITGPPVSKIYRATIDSATCSIASTQDITAANIGISTLVMNMGQTNQITAPGIIRSNHITFADTIKINLTPPSWMVKGNVISVKSASSYLEANISNVASNSVSFNQIINTSGTFNPSINATAAFTGNLMTITLPDETPMPTWLSANAPIQILSDPAGTTIYDGNIGSVSGTAITLATAPSPVKIVLTSSFSGASITITGIPGSAATSSTLATSVPWLQGGTIIQIRDITNNNIYQGLVNAVSGQIITLAAAPDTAPTTGNYTYILTTFNIFLYDSYTISDIRPNALNTAGTWTTPITIGSGVFRSSTRMDVEGGSTSYIVGSPIILSSDKNPSFNATITAYSGTTLTISITSGSGISGQTYTIQQKAKPVVFPTLPEPISPIDWIDCTSAYAKAATGRSTGLTQVDVNTCAAGGTNFPFTRISGDTLQLAANPTPTNIANDGSCTDFSSDSTKRITGYGSLIVGAPTLISGTTYEYRVTTLDTLAFGDTYKDVTFYGQSGCKVSNIQSASISTSPNANFRLLGAPTATSAAIYATLFINWWNVTYYYANATQNKRAIGTITGYYYDSSTDALVFQCTSAEFGPNGPADIRKYNETGQVSTYPSNTCYSVVFRRRYGKTATIPTNTATNQIISADSTSTDFMVYSARAVSAPSAAITTINVASPATSAYTKMTNADSVSYIITRPTDALTNNFRFLRFSVSQVAYVNSAGSISRYTSSVPWAEITRIYFYKRHDTSAIDTDGYLENAFPKSYSDTINNGQGIALLNATFRLSDISSNYFNYMNTDCSGGFVKVPNPYKTSYNICVVDDRRDPTIQAKYEYPMPAVGGCSIGFVPYAGSYQNTIPSQTYNTNINTCITTGTFGSVNDFVINANKNTSRLRLNVGQSLIINLGGVLQIDAYTFVTGSVNNIPLAFRLEGSANGITWKTLNEQTTIPLGSTNQANGISFYVPGYFPTNGGAVIPLTMRPWFYTGQAGNTNFEGFTDTSAPAPTPKEAPKPEEPYFKPDETTLAPRYDHPISAKVQANNLYQPLNTQARRIKTMQLRILETYDPKSKFVHMSMFQFHTAVGPVPYSMIRVSNPMGSRRSPADGPEAALTNTPTKRWVDYNKMPILFTFSEYPQEPIIGFQFAFPSHPNAQDAVPSQWRLEGSYDGRTWEVYHEQNDRPLFIGTTSPFYKFKNAI